jgi:CheY-like chemotaxis protein
LVSGPFDTNTDLHDDYPVLYISVQDSGPGIAQGQEHNLFRKFAQLEASSSTLSHPDNDSNNKTPVSPSRKNKVGQPGGTGLGLNLCLRFVRLMKGNIWVNNNPDGQPGATFAFFLPSAKQGTVIPRPPSLQRLDDPSLVGVVNGGTTTTASLPLQSSTQTMPIAPRTLPLSDLASMSHGNSTLRVLVVDDILINRKVLERMLRKIGVTSIYMAESGEDALQQMETNEFDLIISDLQMPGGMSGLELSEEIRKRQEQLQTHHLERCEEDGEEEGKKQRHAPFQRSLFKTPLVVGLTADTSPDLYGRCLESGMVDVIHKPITVGDLNDTLVRWRE